MQIPIPQSGARVSPFTETRHCSPAIMIAAATLVPSANRIGLPLTVTEIQFSLNNFSPSADTPAAMRGEGAFPSHSLCTILYIILRNKAKAVSLEPNQHRYTRFGIWEVGFFLMKNPV